MQTVHTNINPMLPAGARSILLEPAHTRNLAYIEYADGSPYSALDLYEPELGPTRNRNRMDRALTKAAGVVQKMQGSTLETVIDRYTSNIDSIEKNYENVEEFIVSTAGIKREEFRQGLGFTTAAGVTMLGTLHMVKPAALSDEILGTKVRAGYDVTRLDDPRIVLSYNNRVNVIMGKDGLGGKFGANGIVYGADINVRKARASADLTLQNGLSLGTMYSLRAQEVKGYLNLSF